MSRPSTRALVVVGVLVALLLAGVASYYASSDPDGLNRVAEDQGIAQTEREHEAGERRRAVVELAPGAAQGEADPRDRDRAGGSRRG